MVPIIVAVVVVVLVILTCIICFKLAVRKRMVVEDADKSIKAMGDNMTEDTPRKMLNN